MSLGVRPPVRVLLAVAFVLAAAVVGWSKCGGHSVPRHGDYVACAVGIARQRVTAGSLPGRCQNAVKKCAARSTCGKPGFVTCCLGGATSRCKLKRDEAHCAAKGGTPRLCDSCCDACTPGGCGAGLRTGGATP